MRRVIDDTHYDELAERIMGVVFSMPAAEVSKYDYGMYRAQLDLIMDYILKRVDNLKFGKSMNTTSIGNNACYEIIYTGDEKEEQICGIFHSTNDMYGGQIIWCSMYDNREETHGCRKIKGVKGA